MAETETRQQREPAVVERTRESREGAPITLEKLTISRPVREAIERQFQREKSKPAPSR